jgi:hypothetical protein
MGPREDSARPGTTTRWPVWAAFCVAVALCAALSTAIAEASGAAGRHESIELRFSSRVAGASSGSTYSGTYHAAGNRGGTPPALRRVRLLLPRGAHFDTSVPARCQASDMALESQGESACPAKSKVGSGSVTTRFLGSPPSTSQITVFNTKKGQLELVKFGNGGSAVAHVRIHGNVLDTTVPTCFGGGQPPGSCPTDEAVVLTNKLAGSPLTVKRRGYFTLPASCPRSRAWTSRFTFFFADGSRDKVATKQPCRPAPRASSRR